MTFPELLLFPLSTLIFNSYSFLASSPSSALHQECTNSWSPYQLQLPICLYPCAFWNLSISNSDCCLYLTPPPPKSLSAKQVHSTYLSQANSLAQLIPSKLERKSCRLLQFSSAQCWPLYPPYLQLIQLIRGFSVLVLLEQHLNKMPPPFSEPFYLEINSGSLLGLFEG